MALIVKHEFVSAVPDGTDTSQIQPSNWNEAHTLSGSLPIANVDGLTVALADKVGSASLVTALADYDTSASVDSKIVTANAEWVTSASISDRLTARLADYDASASVDSKIVTANAEWVTSASISDRLTARLADYDASASVVSKIATHAALTTTHGISGAIVGTTDNQTLTTKTIDGDNNTISNLDIGNEVDWPTAADVTDRTAFASGDKLIIQEAGVGLRKIDYDDLPGAGGGLSNVVEDTTPQLGGQLDVNGQAIGDGTLELLTFTEDPSAINHVNIENEAIGSGPIISAAGDDTDVDLNLAAKGTGAVQIGGSAILVNSDIDADVKTLALPANTTISAFGATLVDDLSATAARATLGGVITSASASAAFVTSSSLATTLALYITSDSLSASVTTESLTVGGTASFSGTAVFKTNVRFEGSSVSVSVAQSIYYPAGAMVPTTTAGATYTETELVYCGIESSRAKAQPD